jgi:hydrogenase maturation protease
MSLAVVIAYGNPLREDDGVAWAVGERLRQLGPDAEVLTVHQLTPELAETLSDARVAVFVDARVGGSAGDVSSCAIEPSARSQAMTHGVGPEALLAYSLHVFGRAPRAYLVTVAGERFGVGSGLSDAAARAVPEAARRAAELIVFSPEGV